MDTSVATSRRIPRIGGCFECALDVCFGSHDAALHESYSDPEGGRGVLYYSDEKVINFCRKANRLGLQIELHAIGSGPLTRLQGQSRPLWTTFRERITDMVSSMTACPHVKELRYAVNTVSRCLFRALSLAGDRNRTPILSRSLERSVLQPSIR